MAGRMDPVAGVPVDIDLVHTRIHKGDHWVATHSVIVGTGTAASVLITAPVSTTAIMHFVYSVVSSNAGIATFSEAPNASGGTAIIAYNSSRDTSGSANAIITHSATWLSSGTILENFTLGGANAGTRVGDSGEGRVEWVLGSEKLYLVYFVATNATTTVDINAYWYEVS